MNTTGKTKTKNNSTMTRRRGPYKRKNPTQPHRTIKPYSYQLNAPKRRNP